MATTTNYSFPTPDDTDLVKDGASAIRSLGTAVDTQIKDLSPGTTAGDIDYYTTSTAKARVGIGTAGQVLQVNSGATAPEWATPTAGGMTLISTTSLSGTSVTLTSIPQTYIHLNLIIVNNRTNFNGEPLAIRFNADTGANRHYNKTTYGLSADASPANTFITVSPSIRTGVTNSLTNVHIPYYTDTTTRKLLTSESIGVDSATATNSGFRVTSGFYNQDGATSSLVILSQDGGTFQAGTVYLYGVK